MKKFLVLACLLVVSTFVHAQSYSPWRYIAATNCSTSNGIAQDLCKKTSDSSLWVCSSASGCSGSGWIQVGSSASGTVTSIATSNGITGGTITTSGTISGVNAVADGATKGVAAFTAVDFNDNSSGLISIDYTNGQKASGSQPGFLSSTDWTTFNGKQAGLSLVAGTYSDGKGCSYTASGTVLNCNNSYLTGNQSITLSGDVSGSGATAITTVVGNIPTAVTAAGTIIQSNISAPSSPASGKVAVYSDSTDLRFHDKNASGVIGTTVVSDTGASHNFLTAVSSAGAISKAQPAQADITGLTTSDSPTFAGLALGSGSVTMTGSLGTTGARLTKGWFTDLQVTNAITGSITGNAATVTTNANLTGAVTSSGNATSLGSFSSSNLSGALTDETGSGVAVFGTAPTFTTSINLGAANLITDTSTGTDIATATTQKIAFYGVTPIVQPSGDILTALNGTHLGLVSSPTISQADVTSLVASGKTFTANNTLILAGTDSTTMTFPTTSATIARTDAANTFTGHQTIEGVTSAGATGTGNLVFATAPSLTANVGIGSATPGGTLDVESTVSPVVFFGISAGSTGKNVGIGSYAPGYMLDVAGGGRFQANGNSSFNTTGGNVGIGTTLSLNKLDVAGGVSIGTTNAGYNTTPTNGMLVQGNVGIGTTLNNSGLMVGSNVSIGTSYAGIAAPTNGLIVLGNVGIGSSAPGSALDVQGTIRALAAGACTTLYKCVGGVDAGVIQTVGCVLCPGGSCTALNGCF